MSTERRREKEDKNRLSLRYALAFLGLALATVLPQLLLPQLLLVLLLLFCGCRCSDLAAFLVGQWTTALIKAK